jgi:hypothetical protein
MLSIIYLQSLKDKRTLVLAQLIPVVVFICITLKIGAKHTKSQWRFSIWRANYFPVVIDI